MSNTSTQQDTTATGATTDLIQINPAEVVVGSNVRLDARLDKAFVASIRERGVLVPIVGHRDDEGRFVVLYGQRRTLASIEAKRDTIPAYVVASQDAADRLIDQMAENDHRASLTTGDRVKAFEQLTALGLTAAQIAKRTATKRADVDAGLAVAASELAVKAAERFDFLTLDQAAVLADFEDDTEAVKALTVAASEGQFEHIAQRLHDDRDREQARAAMVEKLTSQGVTIVERPSYDDKSTLALHRLAVKAEGRAYNKDTHTKCTGHAAYLTVNTKWDTDDHGKETRVWSAEPTYVCTAWKTEGHADLYASTTSKPTAAEMTPAQREQAKAARRDVIESNKAWDAAEPVRRDWLATFAARKTAPKGTAAFIARVVTEHPEVVPDVGGSQLAAEWFGLKHSGYGYGNGWAALVEKATDGRAQVIALCRLLASLEKGTSRQSWRSVYPATADYLKFLTANGYELSDVEKRAAGIKTRTTTDASN